MLKLLRYGEVRSGLAVDLVRALFCGLPRREQRMAVFICAADESADENPRRNFFYGGFAAPVDDWAGFFADAWNERVLNGPPQIPFVHMTDIRDRDWRAEYGLTERDANDRLDEAARVIRGMGSLIPVIWSLDVQEYNSILRQPFNPNPKQRDTLHPDYISFLFFAYTSLHWLHRNRSDVEKVDFWVEENGKITRHLQGFHDGLAHNLEYIRRPELAALVGELLPVGKTRIPAQAADVLAWHARNHERATLDRDGERRYWRMTIGGNPSSGRGRIGYRVGRRPLRRRIT